MHPTTASQTAPPSDPLELRRERLASLGPIVERAANLLPMPGPITAFAFLNTLQALEDLPFDVGMQRGAELYGCQPYLSEEAYRHQMARDRIHLADLAAVLRDDLRDCGPLSIGPLGTARYDLRLAMLQFPVLQGPSSELQWFVVETDSLTQFRNEAPHHARQRLVDQTRRWFLREVLPHAPVQPRSALMKFRGQMVEPAHRVGGTHKSPQAKTPKSGPLADWALLEELLERFGRDEIQSWNDSVWQSFTLHALWRICYRGAEGVAPPVPKPPRPRHRDMLLAATGEDSDLLCHPVLIRFSAAFVDQGLANWTLPGRDLGFFKAFCGLFRYDGGLPELWMRELPAEIRRLEAREVTPAEIVIESLEALDVAPEETEEFVTSTMLALRGWAGMLWHMETRNDRVPFPVPPNTTLEFLAVRLILDRLALAHVAANFLHYRGPLSGLRAAALARRPKAEPVNVEQRAFLVFQLAQILGWSPPELAALSRAAWDDLLGEIEGFSSVERRRLFHAAFERRFRLGALDSLASYVKRPLTRVENPRFQACFCIDAREESFRRHLEELAPDTETFGAAGFFTIPIYYRGAADAFFTALCPIVLKPSHWLTEDVVYSLSDSNRRRAKTRKALGAASHQLHLGTRNFASGALLTAGLGILASIPLVARVLFPRLTARLRRMVGSFVQPPPVTRLRLERTNPTPGPAPDQIGFTVEEMANFGERVLRDIGLTSGFARLVLFLGHGSFCLNNPHKSAYDCGACSGSAGSPNARALAAFLNDPRIREILAKRGLPIPKETVFLGGLHNTAVDSVTFLDLDLLPNSHIPDFEAAQQTLDAVCARNAHERCRRFESAPLDLTLAAAHRHVEERSEDLAQTRPEYGNSTNAMCFVGRRERTRGLYMDRRVFMHSYDATQDTPEHMILARILGAAVPVCEGINMQYNLSFIDSTGWACGTKLPHNITSLLGVMDGAASDLRPGLPWQGVDIHEPVRLLFVIETTPEGIESIMNRNELVGRILRNGWAQLALLDPYTSELRLFRNGQFELYAPESRQLPRADSSANWYRGWRDHLSFAAIDPNWTRNALDGFSGSGGAGAGHEPATNGEPAAGHPADRPAGDSVPRDIAG